MAKELKLEDISQPINNSVGDENNISNVKPVAENKSTTNNQIGSSITEPISMDDINSGSDYLNLDNISAIGSSGILPSQLQPIRNDMAISTANRYNNPIDPLKDVRNRTAINTEQDGITLTSYSDTPLTNFYKGFEDEMVALYPSYRIGKDNMEWSARHQSTGDKIWNGLLKAGTTALTTTLQGTVGATTMMTNWVSHGFDPHAMYTDPFSSWLSDINYKLSYELPNYYTHEEQDMNFFQKLGTANFWGNELANGLGFMAGFIASEAIWSKLTGGAASGAVAALLRSSRALRYFDDIAEYKTLATKILRPGFKAERAMASSGGEIASAIKKARIASKIGKGLETSRFIVTNGAVQGAIEARGMMREARDNFRNYYRSIGEEPTKEELDRFEDRLETAANGTMALNTALTAATGFLTIGKIFNVSSPLITKGEKSVFKKFADKKLFGLGTKIGKEGKRELIDAKWWQKALGKTTKFASQPIYEGTEEMLQFGISNSANMWIESGYNDDYTEGSISMGEALYDGMANAWGSKEGWNNFAVGAFMGLMSGSLAGEFNKYSEEQKRHENYVKLANSDYFSAQKVADDLMTVNRIRKINNDAEEASNNGDFVKEDREKKKLILTTIAENERYGYGDTAQKDFNASIDLIDSKEVAENSNMTEEEVESYKKEVKELYADLKNKYEKNKEFADFALGDGKAFDGIQNKEVAKSAIAYNLTVGENSYDVAVALFDQIKEELKGVSINESFNKALEVRHKLASTDKPNREEIEEITRNKKSLKDRISKLEKEIIKKQTLLNNVSDETKSEMSKELNDLNLKLAELNDKSRELEVEQEALWSIIKADGELSGDSEYLTTEDVDKLANFGPDGKIIGGELNEIDKYVLSLKDKDPKKFAKLARLFHEYNRSMKDYIEMNKAMGGLVNENLDPGNIRTFLDKKFKGKDANEFTKQYFHGVLSNMLHDQADIKARTDSEKETQGKIDNINRAENDDILEGARDGIDEKVTIFAKKVVEKGYNNLSKEDKKFFQDNQSEVVEEMDRIRTIKDKYSIKRQKVGNEDSFNEGTIDGTEYRITEEGDVYYDDEKIGNFDSPKDAIKGHIKDRRKEELSRIDSTIDDSYIEEGNSVIKNRDNKKYTISKIEDGDVTLSDGKTISESTLKNEYKIDNEKEVKDIEARYKDELKRVNKYQQTSIQETEETGYLQSIKNRILKLIGKNTGLSKYLGNSVESMENNRVTADEYNEYKTLLDDIQNPDDIIDSENYEEYKKVNGDDVPKSKYNRFKELNSKMLNWSIAEGIVDDNGSTNLANLIRTLHLLKQTNKDANTEKTVDNDKVVTVTKSSMNSTKGGSGKRRFRFIQNPNGVYISYDNSKANPIQISHLNVNSFFDKIGNKVEGEELGETNEEGYWVVKVNTEDGVKPVLFRLSDSKSRIELSEDSWNRIKEEFGIQFIRTESKPNGEPYVLGYDVTGDKVTQAESDFDFDTDNPHKFERMPNEEIDRVKKVEVVVDPQNKYNRQLLEEAESIEDESERDKYIADRMTIYLVSDGKMVGQMSANDNKGATSESKNNFDMIRQMAAITLQNSPSDGSNVFLGPEIDVDFKFYGVPIWSFESTDNGLELNNLELNEDTVKQVETSGYVEVNEKGEQTVKLGDENIDPILTYVPKSDRKTPVVVIKYAKKHFAFPVTLIPQDSGNISKQFKEAVRLNEYGDRMLTAIKFLKDRGISQEDLLALEIKNSDVNNLEVLEMLSRRLPEITKFPDVEDWVEKGFDKKELIGKIATPIDLTRLSSNGSMNGNLFNSPKMQLSLQKVSEKDFDLGIISEVAYSNKKSLGPIMETLDNVFQDITRNKTVILNSESELTKLTKYATNPNSRNLGRPVLSKISDIIKEIDVNKIKGKKEKVLYKRINKKITTYNKAIDDVNKKVKVVRVKAEEIRKRKCS